MNIIARKEMIDNIYYKFQNNIELTDYELYLVYGLDDGPYVKDERLEEVLASRDYKKKDLAKLLGVSEKQISLFDEIPEKSVIYHYGDLNICADTIDDFDFPCYVFGSCIIDEVSKIDRYCDGPNGEKIPKMVLLPFYIKKDFVMGSLEEAHRVIFPELVGRNVDLRTLKEIDSPITCEVYGNINLYSMENEDVIKSFNCYGDIKTKCKENIVSL